MRTVIIVVGTSIVTTALAVWVTLSFVCSRWHTVLGTLESVVLEERVDIEFLTLGQAAEALLNQVKTKKHVTLKCVFSPTDLANKSPVTSTILAGNVLDALGVLEYSYDCSAEFAGDHTILFMDESPPPIRKSPH